MIHTYASSTMSRLTGAKTKIPKMQYFNVCINYGSMMSTKLMKRYFINPLHALYSSTSGQLTYCPCSRVPLQADLRTHWPTKRDENTHSWTTWTANMPQTRMAHIHSCQYGTC